MRMTALAVSLLTLAIERHAVLGFRPEHRGHAVRRALPTWIDAIGADYYLGVDGISAPLNLLTAFITPLVMSLAGWNSITSRPAQYFAAFLILEGLMIGVFSALDGCCSTSSGNSMLVPMFLIIGVWGGERRIYATLKFFLYTFLGSVLMLVAFVYLYTSGRQLRLAEAWMQRQRRCR